MAEDIPPAVLVQVRQTAPDMAFGNETLGRFELTGIAPARRGVTQIEAFFEIDAKRANRKEYSEFSENFGAAGGFC
jgi:molecular chaperone DnaK (HSP70)